MKLSETLFLVLIYYSITEVTYGISLRRKIARYQRFRNSGTRDANGNVILEKEPFNKIYNSVRIILPALQKHVANWNTDADKVFEALNPLILVFFDSVKNKYIRSEKRYTELFHAFYPEAAAAAAAKTRSQNS